MNIILLSGGSGKRLWPLSNDIRSKQFLKLFLNHKNEFESMLQRVYNQILAVDKNSTITIATSESQVPAIHNQLGKDVGISVEPCRRDTFPAIVLAAAYLVDVKKVDINESVVVCPVDPYVNESFFESMMELCKLVDNGDTNLALMGINPTYPAEKYGYIIPDSMNDISTVKFFKEKPNSHDAQEYIKQGALWNSGVFAFKLEYVLTKAHDIIEFTDYYDLLKKYSLLNKISFDYAIVEKENNIKMKKYAGEWKDVGTWNTMTESMSKKTIGNAIQGAECENVSIVNELDIPVLAMGLKNIVVAASPDGILVSDKNMSANIKPYVEKIEQKVKYAEKEWGTYEIVDIHNHKFTVKLKINEHGKICFNRKKFIMVAAIVISGSGTMKCGDDLSILKEGSIITFKGDCIYELESETMMTIICISKSSI